MIKEDNDDDSHDMAVEQGAFEEDPSVILVKIEPLLPKESAEYLIENFFEFSLQTELYLEGLDDKAPEEFVSWISECLVHARYSDWKGNVFLEKIPPNIFPHSKRFVNVIAGLFGKSPVFEENKAFLKISSKSTLFDNSHVDHFGNPPSRKLAQYLCDPYRPSIVLSIPQTFDVGLTLAQRWARRSCLRIISYGMIHGQTGDEKGKEAVLNFDLKNPHQILPIDPFTVPPQYPNFTESIDFISSAIETFISKRWPDLETVTLGPMTVKIAGAIFAAGAMGALEDLDSLIIYRILSSGHDGCRGALVLGLALSHPGSMNARIAKVISVHLPRNHPDFMEVAFKVSPSLQLHAIFAMGILSMGRKHSCSLSNYLFKRILAAKTFGPITLALGISLGLVNLALGWPTVGLGMAGLTYMAQLSDHRMPSAMLALGLAFFGTKDQKILGLIRPAVPLERCSHRFLRTLCRSMIKGTADVPDRDHYRVAAGLLFEAINRPCARDEEFLSKILQIVGSSSMGERGNPAGLFPYTPDYSDQSSLASVKFLYDISLLAGCISFCGTCDERLMGLVARRAQDPLDFRSDRGLLYSLALGFLASHSSHRLLEAADHCVTVAMLLCTVLPVCGISMENGNVPLVLRLFWIPLFAGQSKRNENDNTLLAFSEDALLLEEGGRQVYYQTKYGKGIDDKVKQVFYTGLLYPSLEQSLHPSRILKM